MVNNGDNSNEKHIWFYIEKKIFLKRNIKQFNCILLLIDISKWKIIFLILEYDFSFIFFSAIFIQNENHSYDFHVFIYIHEIYIYIVYIRMKYIFLLYEFLSCGIFVFAFWYIFLLLHMQEYYGKGLVCYTSYWTSQK